jgi:hypothetical protein
VKLCDACLRAAEREADAEREQTSGWASSRLSAVARVVWRAAVRRLVVGSLERTGWNFTASAEELGVNGAGNVARALRTADPAAWERAKRAGHLQRGRHKSYTRTTEAAE